MLVALPDLFLSILYHIWHRKRGVRFKWVRFGNGYASIVTFRALEGTFLYFEHEAVRHFLIRCVLFLIFKKDYCGFKALVIS